MGEYKKIAKANNSKKYVILYIITIIVVIFIAIIKYKNNEVSYYNADATWHSLLTIEAYDKTPISKHLFLPIVTLGENTDKNIPWGDTIPDRDGNYYYTSFSPAGYFLPWLFFKLFNLPTTENSLYIFNTLLFVISAMLIIKLITFLYQKSKYVYLLTIIALFVYICAPEILHGQGITYWHQSIMQVTLLIQLYAYLKLKRDNKKVSKYIFYFMTFLNPYIEWTGYVANIGFAIAEFCTLYKKDKKDALKRSSIIVLLTILSFSVFCLHYLLVIDGKLFFEALKNRFVARGITTNVSITSLITGYISSFKYIWLVLLIFIIWNLIKNKKLKLNHKLAIFLCCFPVLENILMKQHAITYSYDRMKLIFPLMLVICDIANNIIEKSNLEKITSGIIIGIVTICSILNIGNYINDTNYIWNTDYRADNEKLAKYINENYKDSVLAIKDSGVRGYINLLFKRGIYEFETLENLSNIAKINNKEYVVMLFLDKYEKWNICDLGGATIYNIRNNTEQKLIVNNGVIEEIDAV